MITSLTFIYAALALIGGFVGARLVQARPSAGVYAAGAGFLASVFAQLNGAAEVPAFLAFLVACVIVASLFRLRALQIGGIVVAVVVVSLTGNFLIAFAYGFEDGFLKALNHSAKR